MTVRQATQADRPQIRELVAAYDKEIWRRPYPPGDWNDAVLDDWHVLVAEDDGRVAGVACGFVDGNGMGEVAFIFVRDEARRGGLAKRLLQELVSYFKSQGATHAMLTIDTSAEVVLGIWRRLGFVEHAVELNSPLDRLEARLAISEPPASYGSLHVQTDDEDAVVRAVKQFVPRLGGSAGSVVVPPRNGWTAVYDERCDRDRAAQRRLAEELSDRLGTVVLALALEEEAVVRFQLFDRGGLVDEYLSVPAYYGPIEKVDEVTLAANPTVIARLTGADPTRVRAAARTAASPAELPPGPELLAEIAGVLAVEGAGHGFAGADRVAGAVVLAHR